ncbi:MAG: phosphopantetheine-binding protein [Polyangiaceae bacterium]
MVGGEETEGRVRAIVARLARRAEDTEIRRDADVYRELGIASSVALELLLSLEDELGVHLPDVEFNEARTIAALCDLIEKWRGR